MCGITGFWGGSFHGQAIAEAMASRISNRGPDDAGVWIDDATGIALAHRRLSILDLSPAGHQPMVSPCGRFVLVYNGEIYNHLELRAELEVEGGAFDWRGHSDTETLLAGLRHWGVEGCLSKLNGMFAFALWDARERQLFLVRDRMGEKPLYYGRSGDAFLFGSELKALAAHPDWRGEVDRDALTLYLRHSYVPAPWSIYKGVYKLPPAHDMVVRENGAVISPPRSYWDLASVAERGVSEWGSRTEHELIDELDGLLRDSVKRRMAADVPLGAFLSGGFDSTVITAMMQAQSERPIKTFTIGFHEEGYNEAKHAKAVARHLGTDHTEMYVSPQEAMSVIPQLPEIWDEPFSDSSQIPTFLVSKLARRDVTVALSGDGGDELFFGYARYLHGKQFAQVARILPGGMRQGLCTMLKMTPARQVNWLGKHLPNRLKQPALGDRLRKLGDALGAKDVDAFYHRLVSHWKEPESIVIGATEPDTLLSKRDNWPDLPGIEERMMYLDSLTYLPDDILAKLDRASMATRLESRVPMLDHRFVEFSWRVPTKFKYRDNDSKWLLRQVLYRYVPQDLMDRPKMGFGVPIEHWLRGPLREWAESLLDQSRLEREGYFRPEPVRTLWEQHQTGNYRWHYYLWDILMFQTWLEKQRDV